MEEIARSQTDSNARAISINVDQLPVSLETSGEILGQQGSGGAAKKLPADLWSQEVVVPELQPGSRQPLGPASTLWDPPPSPLPPHTAQVGQHFPRHHPDSCRAVAMEMSGHKLP